MLLAKYIPVKKRRRRVPLGVLLVLTCMTGFVVMGGVEAAVNPSLELGILIHGVCDSQTKQSLNTSLSTEVANLQTQVFGNVLQISYRLYSTCSDVDALTQSGDIFQAGTHDAVIGIASSNLQLSLTSMSSVYKKPYVAFDVFHLLPWGSLAMSLSPSPRGLSMALVHLLDHFKWGSAAVITTPGEYWRILADDIFIHLNQNNFTVNSLLVLSTENTAEALLQTISDNEKAVILCVGLTEQETLLREASRLDLATKHAFFTFASSNMGTKLDSLLDYSQSVLSESLFYKNDVNILESVFVVSAELPESLSNSVTADWSSLPQSVQSSLWGVLFLEHLTEQYLKDHTSVFTSSLQITPYVANSTFSFNGKYLSFDRNGRMVYSYYLYDFNKDRERFDKSISLIATSTSSWSLHVNRSLFWPNGVVLEEDRCFKDATACVWQQAGLDVVYIILIFAGGVALVIFVIIIAVMARRYWARKELTKGPHKLLLQPADLTFLLKKERGKGSRLMKSTIFDKPDLVKASEPNRSTASINELSDYSETARYNGDLVHVKELRAKNFEIKSKVMTHIRAIRELRHENLNPCVGLLVDTEKPALVMEYCSRGSLEDVIHNEDIKLDWDFKLSLLTDLVRGLRYIHGSTIKCHGNLKSRNCVIDSRWQLRITDYGLPGFLIALKQNRMDLKPRDLLWTAPELLRDPVLMTKGSEKADIFSLGIIMQEVALRTEPYSSTGLTPEAIIAKVKKPPPLIRPSVSPQAAPPQYIQIMKQSWSEMPEMRLNIEEVYDLFKKITGGKKANIVDTMFRMLEKYSNDLEEIVAERTTQLEEEKKKTDQLLYRMLPPTVAESLKIGHPVEAESFEEVTIYFSDIVGFTTISAMSTPMQVVSLLNDLYTMFDATIDVYDVYKVETIGDAYMVSSGLPVRNGNRHAGEIGTMALDLLSQCGKFIIRHMPDVPMRLRIGLHSGSCVAGVVGLTMPRYCLFGDTVNTASRMESTGAAFRIHVSQQCKEVLDHLGGYHLDYRGETELKGKGKAPTYWLVGKEKFTKELPEPPQQSEVNHGLESLINGTKQTTPEAKDLKSRDTNNKADIESNSHFAEQQNPNNGSEVIDEKHKDIQTYDTCDKTVNSESCDNTRQDQKNSIDSIISEQSNPLMDTTESEISVRTTVSVVSASDISIHDDRLNKEGGKSAPSLTPVSELV